MDREANAKKIVKDVIETFTNPTNNKEWFNEDGTVLNNLEDLKIVANKHPQSCKIIELEDLDEIFVSIDTDGDGTFDRNVTYIHGKKTAESVDMDEDFNNEILLEYDSDGKIKKGVVDVDDDGIPEFYFKKY